MIEEIILRGIADHLQSHGFSAVYAPRRHGADYDKLVSIRLKDISTNASGTISHRDRYIMIALNSQTLVVVGHDQHGHSYNHNVDINSPQSMDDLVYLVEMLK